MRTFQLKRQCGNALIIVVIALPVFFAIAALVVDGTSAFVQKRQMQNAADAAALAAAQDLGPAFVPGCDLDPVCMDGVRSSVEARATDYSRDNRWSGPPGPLPQCTQPANTGETNCYTWPYNGSNAKVEVRLRNDVDTFFTDVVGMTPGFMKAGARAVAAATGGTALHCVFPPTAEHPEEVDNPDQYLNTDPPCTMPGQPARTGEYHEPNEEHCLFTPPLEDPDQYLNTNPPCTGPPIGGLNGAMALAMSRECDAISYNGAGGGSVGTLVTNGGIWFSGNEPKRVQQLGYDLQGCPGHPDIPPSGTTQCDNSGNFTCAKELVDFSDITPINWPVPPPPQPSALPSGTTWNPSSHYPSQCIDLGTTDVTFAAGDGPPGIYCVRGGARLTLSGDLTNGDGYTFFALGGGRIQISSNGTRVKFYWPSACNSEYGHPLTDGRPTTRPTSFTCFGRTITGYEPQVLLYATNTTHSMNCDQNAICINGQNSSVEGDMFAVAPSVFPPPDRSP